MNRYTEVRERTRMIVAACGMGVMNMHVVTCGTKAIDTRPYHVRNNQAPRRYRKR
jgi:hypothetical protein